MDRRTAYFTPGSASFHLFREHIHTVLSPQVCEGKVEDLRASGMVLCRACEDRASFSTAERSAR